jgi:hypothetical protein
MQAQSVARPAFTITPVKRTRVETRAKKDDQGFVTYEHEVEEDGFMVKTRRGDEVFLSSLAEVKRLGLDKLVPLISDASPDDPVGYMEPNLGAPMYSAAQVDDMVQKAVQKAVAEAMAVYTSKSKDEGEGE